MLHPETLEPHYYDGNEPEYRIESLLGRAKRERVDTRAMRRLYPPTVRDRQAIDHVVELSENSDLFRNRSPSSSVRDFLEMLFSWKRYHDSVLQNPSELQEFEDKYLNYRVYRQLGFYPLPRIVLESWNASSCTRIKNWLVSLGILTPVINHCKGSNCTYYSITYPEHSIVESERTRTAKALRDLINTGKTTVRAISAELNVDERAVRYWLNGTRRAGHSHQSGLVRFLIHHGHRPDEFLSMNRIKATLPPAVRFQLYLYHGPSSDVVRTLKDVGHIETSSTKINMTSDTVVCLKRMSITRLCDLAQQMSTTGTTSCRIVTQRLQDVPTNDPTIQIIDLRNPRSWILHLIAHLGLDTQHPDVAIVLRNAQFFGRRRSEAVLRSICARGKDQVFGYQPVSHFLKCLVFGRDPQALIQQYHANAALYGHDIFFPLIVRFVRMSLRANKGKKAAGSPTYYLHTLALRFNTTRGIQRISAALATLRPLPSCATDRESFLKSLCTVN